MGIKPLFWAHFENIFIFGSELKTLCAYPRCQPLLNLRAMTTYLRFRYIPARTSIDQDVHKREPGSLLTFKPRPSPQIEQYWDFRHIATRNARELWSFDEAETVDQIEQILGESIRQ